MIRVTLLTDFGTMDGFVGVMKGVLLSRAPHATMVDITHEIPRGDVEKGARVLGRTWSAFPKGTIHLVVVDPGVGTPRRGVAVASQGHQFVAPDNGVLTPVLGEGQDWTCVELLPSSRLPAPESRTFHGRDLFAPAAGLLAAGVPLLELGTLISDPVRLDLPPSPLPAGHRWGEVIEIDRFGNLATNLPPSEVEGRGGIRVGDTSIPLRETYGEVSPGDLLAVVNSDGLVEIAVRDGSAADRLGIGVGGKVSVAEA